MRKFSVNISLFFSEPLAYQSVGGEKRINQRGHSLVCDISKYRAFSQTLLFLLGFRVDDRNPASNALDHNPLFLSPTEGTHHLGRDNNRD